MYKNTIKYLVLHTSRLYRIALKVLRLVLCARIYLETIVLVTKWSFHHILT